MEISVIVCLFLMGQCGCESELDCGNTNAHAPHRFLYGAYQKCCWCYHHLSGNPDQDLK